MVVLIRELGNITSDFFTICATTNEIASDNDIVMSGDSFDLLFNNACNNYDDIYGCSLVHSAYSLRTPSMFLSKCEESYAKRIEKQNDRINEDEPVILTNSSIVLEHVTLESQKDQVSKVANNTNAAYQQHVPNEVLALN